MKLPQTPIELITSQVTWAHKNINNTLGFVPADKLGWKPGPDSKSVLEIINHATDTVHGFVHFITEKPKGELPEATDLASAQALVTRVVEAHLETIQALTPEELEQVVSTPLGDFPKGFIAGLPVIELINHHGQITYIESLLGDTDDHLLNG